MKKIISSILLIMVMVLPISVMAKGGITVSPETIEIEEGSTKTFTITANNTIGDVTIKSGNESIAKVSSGEWGTGMVEANQTKTGTITVTGKSIGTTNIVLNIDAATFDEEDLSGQKKTIKVNVIKKKTEVENKPSGDSNTEQNGDSNTEQTPEVPGRADIDAPEKNPETGNKELLLISGLILVSGVIGYTILKKKEYFKRV